MQIVIDISDNVYGLLKYFEKSLGLNDKKDGNDDIKTALMRAVINGTPLPKCHGKLIDENDLMPDSDYEDGIFYAVSIGMIGNAPTIIEADTESEESDSR